MGSDDLKNYLATKAHPITIASAMAAARDVYTQEFWMGVAEEQKDDKRKGERR